MSDNNPDDRAVFYTSKDGRELHKTTFFDDDPPKWETVKTAEEGEVFTDFRIEYFNVVYHLDSTKGKYTGRPNADGGIDWVLDANGE